VDAAEVRTLLGAVAVGTTSVEDALRELADGPLRGYADLGFARLDHHRGLRTGDPEVVYAEGKTTEQVLALLAALAAAPGDRPAVATRLTPAMFAPIRDAFPGVLLDETAACAAVGEPARRSSWPGRSVPAYGGSPTSASRGSTGYSPNATRSPRPTA
jgi:hypothetical protein